MTYAKKMEARVKPAHDAQYQPRNEMTRVPGAAQRGAKRSGALQTRDPGSLLYQSNRGPGSAVHRALSGGKV